MNLFLYNFATLVSHIFMEIREVHRIMVSRTFSICQGLHGLAMKKKMNYFLLTKMKILENITEKNLLTSKILKNTRNLTQSIQEWTK